MPLVPKAAPPPRHRHGLTLLLVILSALAFFACSTKKLDKCGTCSKDDDCAAGLACDAKKHVCRTPGDYGVECVEDCADRCRSTGECTPSETQCSVGSAEQCKKTGGTCIPTRDEDCRQSKSCETLGACSFYKADPGLGSNPGCQAMTDQDCAGADTCKKGGRCKANDGVCSKTGPDCATASGCRMLGWCTQVGTLCRPTTNEDCKASTFCGTNGSCSFVGGGCRAASDVDCNNADLCTKAGACTAKEGACVATSDAVCRASNVCRTDGSCSLVGGACKAVSDLDCKNAETCRKEGKCTPVDGACRVTVDAMCKGSEQCRALGKCSLHDQGQGMDAMLNRMPCEKSKEECAKATSAMIEGMRALNACVALTDEDCTSAEVCTKDGKCNAVKGACTTTTAAVSPCAQLVRSGSKLRWTSRAGDVVHAKGGLTITGTSSGAFQASQTNDSTTTVSPFTATLNGSHVQFRSLKLNESWEGSCHDGQISGTVRGFTFTMVPGA